MQVQVAEHIEATASQTSSVWRSYAIFSLCALCYLVPFIRFMFVGADEGTLLAGAARIYHGQVYARDFFEVMGPGTFYWLAGFFKLFGVTMLAREICLLISSLGSGFLMYFLSRQICKQYGVLPCVLLAATYFGAAWPGISHHVDSNFFALLSIACVVLWHSHRKAVFLVAAGALAGVTTCVLQPKGVFLLVAFAVWVWLQHRSVKTTLPFLGLLSVGYLGVITLVLVYFWSQGALGDLIYPTFTFATHDYGSVNKVAYAQGIFKDYWFFWLAAASNAKWFIGIAVVLITPFLLIALLPLLLAALAFRYRWRSTASLIPLYCLAGLALWLGELHRRDIYHLVFGSPLLLILCVHALDEWRSKLATLGLRVLAISAVSLASFNWLIVAAAAHPIETNAGKVRVLGSYPALVFLEKHAQAGEEIFVYPYSPSYYFLSGTTNPTPYSFLMYAYNPPSQFRKAVQVLDQRRVRYVIWDTTFISKTSKEVFPGSQPQNAAGYILEPYLESHYKTIQDFNGIRVMERK